MKTKLPYDILSKDMAEKFLRELADNNEMYHPDGDAHQVVWTGCLAPDYDERTHLNHLMKQVFDYLPDPCQFVIEYQMTDEQRANHKFYDGIPEDVRQRQLFLPDNHENTVSIAEFMQCNLLEKDVTFISLDEAQKVLDLQVNGVCHAGAGCRVIRIK